MGKTSKLSKEVFIIRSDKVHNKKYTYSLTTYVNSITKVIITCPTHGNFKQTPKNHMNGSGCPDCGFLKQCEKRRKSNYEFINEANKTHNNKYSYGLTKYISSHHKLIITCPIHGNFKQTPKAHITLSQGCPNCYNEIRKYTAPSWNIDSWVNTGLNSIHYDSFKCYVIKCFNDNETFIKVGRTFNKLKTRMQELPYQYEILKIVESDDGRYIFNLEKRFKDIYKSRKYKPNIKFGGMYECFKI